MTLNCLVFDIETIPDTDVGRRILGLEESDDAAVAAAMFAARQEATGSDFLPYEQHRIVAISAVLRSGDQFHVWSLGGLESPEDELVTRYHRIANLYIMYTNCGSYADEFGREFFHAVGAILNGTPVDKLVLHHVAPKMFEEVGRPKAPSKGGKKTGNTKTKKKGLSKPAKKKAKKPRAPAKKKSGRKKRAK